MLLTRQQQRNFIDDNRFDGKLREAIRYILDLCICTNIYVAGFINRQKKEERKENCDILNFMAI